MSTITELTDLEADATSGEDGICHVFCCADDNVALCGKDVTEEPCPNYGRCIEAEAVLS